MEACGWHVCGAQDEQDGVTYVVPQMPHLKRSERSPCLRAIKLLVKVAYHPARQQACSAPEGMCLSEPRCQFMINKNERKHLHGRYASRAV